MAVLANAHGQGEDSGGGKGRLPRERAHGLMQILQDGFHGRLGT
jgi:hypothetical protein